MNLWELLVKEWVTLRKLHPLSKPDPSILQHPLNYCAAGARLHGDGGERLESHIRVCCHQSSPRKVTGLIFWEVQEVITPALISR